MIIRTEKNRNYSVINNMVLRDSRLTWKARGIAAYLFSMPDDWSINSEYLWKSGVEGRDSVRNALRELSDLGYLQRRKYQNNKGRWVTELALTESPTPENQASVNQASVNQSSVNQALYQVLKPSTDNQVLKPSTDNQNPPTTTNVDPIDEPSTVDTQCGGGGFHLFALGLIYNHLSSFNAPDAFIANLDDNQAVTLCKWLWVCSLLDWSKSANQYADYEEIERIDDLYGNTFAGINNPAGLIRKRVEANIAPMLSPDDLVQLLEEVENARLPDAGRIAGESVEK